MNSREQFEVWQLGVYCGGEERLKRCSNDDSTYYFQDVQLKWKAWQASRASIQNLLLPYVNLTPEMREEGDKAVARAKEDQCYSVPVLQVVFFEAAAKVLLRSIEDAFEAEGLTV